MMFQISLMNENSPFIMKPYAIIFASISSVNSVIVTLSIIDTAYFVGDRGSKIGESIASYTNDNMITRVMMISVTLDLRIFAKYNLSFSFSGNNPSEFPLIL